MFFYYIMEVCKTFDASLSNIHVFGVTFAEQHFSLRYFYAFVIVDDCQLLAALLLLYWHRNIIQLIHTRFPDLNNMGNFL